MAGLHRKLPALEYIPNMCKQQILHLKEGIFTVVFQRPVRLLQKKPTQKPTQKILQLINKNKGITTIEIAEKIGITRDVVAKQIAKLKKQGIIDREGSDKSGIWVIIKDVENE
jgi:predicted HTH transcriptional regulator